MHVDIIFTFFNCHLAIKNFYGPVL